MSINKYIKPIPSEGGVGKFLSAPPTFFLGTISRWALGGRCMCLRNKALRLRGTEGYLCLGGDLPVEIWGVFFSCLPILPGVDGLLG